MSDEPNSDAVDILSELENDAKNTNNEPEEQVTSVPEESTNSESEKILAEAAAVAESQTGEITKEESVIETMLDYQTGLDKYFGLVEIAEKYEIFKKVSTRYEMPDGTKVFEKAIIKNPEKYFTEDIMKQLEEAVFQEFNYGSKKGEQDVEE